jgi:Tfp pilus assembly protein PilP
MKQSLFRLPMLFGCVWFSVAAWAQPPGPALKNPSSKLPLAIASAPPAAAATAPASQAVVVPSYKYEAKGRRDPFRNLDVVNTIQATSAPMLRPPGLKGQLVSEINLVGIVLSKGEYIAMGTGYRGRTYFVHPNDELYDGKVLQIRKDAVVFNQIVNDSQGKKLSQQVVKKLYPTRGEGNDAK